jgi:hypothetical protein
VLHHGRAFENAGEAVVVGRGDGVELMVVTAGTAEREAEEGAPEGVDLLINDVHLHLGFIDFREDLRSDGQEAGRDELFVPLVLIRGP